MKKVLSFFMAILCMLPCVNVKAISTTDLSDCVKVLTYKYDELDELIAKHKRALEKLQKTRGLKENLLIAGMAGSLISSCGLAIKGVILCANKKKKNIPLGTATCALGAACLAGIPYSIKAMDNLAIQISNLKVAIYSLSASKERIGALDEQSRNNSSYSLYIDKNGYVCNTALRVCHGCSSTGVIECSVSSNNLKSNGIGNLQYKFPE